MLYLREEVFYLQQFFISTIEWNYLCSWKLVAVTRLENIFNNREFYPYEAECDFCVTLELMYSIFSFSFFFLFSFLNKTSTKAENFFLDFI